MDATWGIFRHKRLPQQKVTTGRFEIERNGEVAYLEYSLSGSVLELTHTEVPKKIAWYGARFLSGRNGSALGPREQPQGRHYLSISAGIRSEATGVLGSCYAMTWRLMIRANRGAFRSASCAPLYATPVSNTNPPCQR